MYLSYTFNRTFVRLPGDLSPAGWRSAAGALAQPSFPLWRPLEPLPDGGGSRNGRTRWAQSAAPAHGTHGAESSTEPSGDR